MTTIVFPGQGSQYIDMSKDFYDNFLKAREIFELISDTSNINLKNIIFNNQSDTLNQTKYTQLAIFCASMSIYNVFKTEINTDQLDIKCMMGHSLGEYSALTAAKILSIEDCSLLLKIRGDLMQNAYEPNQSGMVAIIGMSCKIVEEIIKLNHLNIEIANDNSPLQVVVSGKKKDLADSEKFFLNEGAKKYIFLNVSAAFHSNLMLNSQDKMKNHINNTFFNKSNMSIISNFTGKICKNNKEIIQNLSYQMSNRVRWVESVKTLEENEEKNIIEIGPGKVLTGLIKRISKNFNIINIETITDLENYS